MNDATLIRFVTPLRHPRTGRRLGLFQAWGQIQRAVDLPADYHAYLCGLYQWFDVALAVPAWNRRLNHAAFWFRASSRTHAQRGWELAWALRGLDVAVDAYFCQRPGAIVYQDANQVAAIPFRDEARRAVRRPL